MRSPATTTAQFRIYSQLFISLERAKRHPLADQATAYVLHILGVLETVGI